MASPTSITSTSHFNSILSSHTVVIADFYADWCGPCKAIAPVYAKLCASFSAPNRVAFVKIDTDAQKDIAAKYQITAMPTFVLFRSGRETNRIRGADPSALQDAVRKAAADAPAAAPAVFTTKGHTLGAAPSVAKTGAPKWISNGTVGAGVPFGARLAGWWEVLVRFLGLYLVTLFSLDQDKAAQTSRFNAGNGPRGNPRQGGLKPGGRVGPGVQGCTKGGACSSG